MYRTKRSLRYGWLLAAMLAFLWAASFGGARAEEIDTRASKAGGINSWWVYPLSVRQRGISDKTYTSYVDSQGWCGVIEYDNKKGTQKRVNIVQENVDDHNAGAVEVLPDGKLIYITTGHNTRSYLRVFISAAAGDAGKWQEQAQLPTPAKCTYIQLIKSKRGYYLFTRLRYSAGQLKNGDRKRYTWAVAYSKNGKAWTSFCNVISGGDCQYYIKAMPCTDSTDIRLVACSNPNSRKTDLRVIYYDPLGQRVTDQGGKTLYKITRNGWGLYYKDTDVAVKQSSGSVNRLLDVGYTGRKKTVINYTTASSSKDSDYQVAEVTEKGTKTVSITNSGKAFYKGSKYFGGMAFSEKNANVLYLSRYTGKYWQIEQWKKTKGKWKRVKILKRSRTKLLIRPFVTKDGRGQVSCSYGAYNPTAYKEYHTEIVLLKK